MNVDPGFFLSVDNLELLKNKSRRVSMATILEQGNIASVGSRVTLMDCLDSQVHRFRLVKSVQKTGASGEDLPVDSTLGLSLLGCRTGDYLRFSLGGEEGGTVVLAIDNKN